MANEKAFFIIVGVDESAGDAFGIGALGLPALAIRCQQFKGGTKCPPVGIQLWLALAHFFDVIPDIGWRSNPSTL